jgi:hypothetical protein
MLTREGFVATDMSAPTILQRSSWKAEAIRKGNLKISGPIPIMEDTPLNEEEEKEFAETGALQSPSQPSEPQDELDTLDARPQTPPQTELLVPSIPLAQRASLTSHPVDDQDILPQRTLSKSPPRPRQVPEIARESIVESTSHSQNGFRATPESASKASEKQKKRKSGLRNVFRKMFGRKDKDVIEEEPVQRGHNYHRSVSQHVSSTSIETNLSRTRACSSNHLHGKRSHLAGLAYLSCLSKTCSLYIHLGIVCRFP